MILAISRSVDHSVLDRQKCYETQIAHVYSLTHTSQLKKQDNGILYFLMFLNLLT